MPRLLIALVIGGLIGCNQGRAQSTAGEMRGRIQTAGGLPVGGANIIVIGESLQGQRMSDSDSNGNFRVINLPVGHYTITVLHLSYRPMIVNGVIVRLGIMTNIGNLVLQEAVSTLDTVIVTADGRYEGSGLSDRISRTQIDNLPVDRDYRNAITLLPRINSSYFGDGLSINGSTGAENMFYVDGINVTDNYTSKWAPSLNNASFLPYNFVREVNVLESGYSAEYGRAIGGIVDVLTQSGSNKQTGQVFAYYSGSILNASPKGGTTGAAIGKTSNYDAGFSLGGPIVKDRLWYFAAYSYFQNERETQIGKHGYFPDRTTTHLLALKLDWKTSKRTSATVTLIADPTQSTPILTTDASGSYVPEIVVNPDAMWARTSNGGINISASGHSQVAKYTHLEYSLSGYKKKADFEGATESGAFESQFFDAPAGAISGGVGYYEYFDIAKQNAKVKLSHHQGKHILKTGLELEVNTMTGANGFPERGDIFKFDTSFFARALSQSRVNVRSLYEAVFYQHNWEISEHVLLEAGIRWERQQLRDGRGNVLQTFNNLWQPRIGITWFNRKDGDKKLTLNYGRVYQSIPMNFNLLYGSGTDDYRFTWETFSMDPRLPGATADATLIDRTAEDIPFSYDKYVLTSNYCDQLAIQYRQAMGRDLSFHVRLLAKNLGDVFLLASDTSFNVFLGNPGKGELSFMPRVRQQYTALELGIAGKTEDGTLTFGLYYVLSRNYGNYSGYWDQEFRYFSEGSATLGSQTTNTRASRTTGLLPGDRTHTLKFNVACRFKSGVMLGSIVSAASGTPLNEYILNPWTQLTYDLLSKRGTSGRLPMLWDANIRLAYQKPSGRLRLTLDALHVGNPQQVVDQVQLKYQDPAGLIANPTFGKPVRRQAPMALRFGIEYSF